MGLGITRENIGDILVEPSGAFIFVKQEIADYITSNLEKIGRCGLKRLCAGVRRRIFRSLSFER